MINIFYTVNIYNFTKQFTVYFGIAQYFSWSPNHAYQRKHVHQSYNIFDFRTFNDLYQYILAIQFIDNYSTCIIILISFLVFNYGKQLSI